MRYANTPPVLREARAKEMAARAEYTMLGAVRLKLPGRTIVAFFERASSSYVAGILLLGEGHVCRASKGDRFMGRLVVEFHAYFDHDRLEVGSEGTDPYRTTWDYVNAAYLCVKERVGSFKP